MQLPVECLGQDAAFKNLRAQVCTRGCGRGQGRHRPIGHVKVARPHLEGSGDHFQQRYHQICVFSILVWLQCGEQTGGGQEQKPGAQVGGSLGSRWENTAPSLV